MASLSLSGLTKRYGDTVVVDGVSLDVADGEFLVLLGPSGCGKTTTLRMIAGFIPPTAGAIRLGAREVTDMPPWKRNAGLVFQSYALFPHLTVAQNVAFGLEMRKATKADIAPRVTEALELVRLGGLGDRFPRQLSGGQQQRVALARALVIRPDVLLLDEPLSNLDAKLRGHMRTELAMLHERLGKTTIYVTHDQVEAMTLASRIVIFHKGHIQQVGAPSEVFNRPANLFVAGFVGMPSMNLLEGTLTPQGDQMFLRGSGFSIPLPVAGPWPAQLVAGVRPQALRLASGTGLLQLQVDVVEYLGTESVLVGKLAGGSEDRITAVVSGHRIDLLHQTVALEFDASELHTFDRSTGLRVHV
jgi:ABC-type sugar transport system ATPase subunit